VTGANTGANTGGRGEDGGVDPPQTGEGSSVLPREWRQGRKGPLQAHDQQEEEEEEEEEADFPGGNDEWEEEEAQEGPRPGLGAR